MEEDIKLLKEMKQNCLTKREYIDTKAERKAQAIENALNRLAELEKENKRQSIAIIGYQEELENVEDDREQLEKENAELKAMLKNRIKYTQELEKDLFENASHYVVPKSAIRKKIEEYENYLQENTDEQGHYCGIKSLYGMYRKIETLKEIIGEEK